MPHRSYDAIRVEREMTGRVHSVPIPAWEIPELLQIAREGFPLLNIDASQGVCVALAKETYGSPHLMQEFCRILAQTHNVSETPHSTVTIATIKPELFRSAANSSEGRFFTASPRARIDRVHVAGYLNQLRTLISTTLHSAASHIYHQVLNL